MKVINVLIFYFAFLFFSGKSVNSKNKAVKQTRYSRLKVEHAKCLVFTRRVLNFHSLMQPKGLL